MRRLVLWTVLAAMLLGGCGGKLKRLSDVEKGHYYALRVYMDDDLRKEYLRQKTEEDRNGWLHAAGLWDRFYSHDAETRDEIIAGEVQIGWEEEMVLMAWGLPFERRRLTGRPAERSELFVYRFEVDTEGYVRVWEPKSKTAYKSVKRVQRELFIDDRRVTEIVEKERWE